MAVSRLSAWWVVVDRCIAWIDRRRDNDLANASNDAFWDRIHRVSDSRTVGGGNGDAAGEGGGD